MDIRTQRTAKNFIKMRGRKNFKLLLDMFHQQLSGEYIAEKFEVSRERVRQWRDIFGRTVKIYEFVPGLYQLTQEEQDECEASGSEDRALPDDCEDELVHAP